MPQLTQLATSTMYVWQQVTAVDVDGTVIDPTGDPAYLAFLPQPNYGPVPDPQDSDFHLAIWGTGPGPTYWAGVLVGPANGGLVLAKGPYLICTKVTDDPEVPEIFGWGLTIV